MPMNLGFFFIRKPRVSQYNAVSTIPPSSQGTYSLKLGLSISYIGSGATSAILDVTGNKVQIIIDQTLEHTDNLNIDVIGRSIQDLVNEINDNTNYTAQVLTANPEELCLLEGSLFVDINNKTFNINYNKEIEYMVDTFKPGKLGDCSISYKEEDFIYSGENSRWMIDEGFISDDIDVPVGTDGVISLGSLGVQMIFFPAISDKNDDISRIVTFKDLELVQSLDTPISEAVFSASPLLIDGTLELKINQKVQTEGLDYIIDYGIPGELRTINESPYTFNSTNNIFRIRHNSNPAQEFIIPEGTITAEDLADFINQEARGFLASSFLDEDTRLEYFTVTSKRGTFYHQIRIEDGSANSTLGYTDFLAAKGEANGKLLFLTHVPVEDITPIERTSNLKVNAIETATDNPFLGVYPDNFKLKEAGKEKELGKDYLVTDNGAVQLVSEIDNEDLVSGILTEDNALFPDSYNVYDNGKKLTVNVDYKINPQGGWITLLTSAFPGHVFTADYAHKTVGVIEGEVLLGERANIDSTVSAPYSIPLDNFILKVAVNNGATQSFSLPPGNGIVIEDVISAINSSAIGFEAYQSKTNVLSLRTLSYGPEHTLSVLDGSFNVVVGFEDFYSAAGSGAEGGEQALQTAHTPMEIGGFTAPKAGDTIIIKNNDITDRYSTGTMIKLLNDYYQVRDTYLETRANLINSVSEPYTIIEKSNSTLKFTIDNNDETTVELTTGKGINVDFIVSQINAVHPNAAKAMFVNGIKRIQFIGDTYVSIGEGNANRTLGFEGKSEDTNDPDTFLFVTSKFKTIYVNPVMSTTVSPVNFIDEVTDKEEAPQNTNEVVFKGDVTSTYQENIVIRLDNKYFYTVKSASYDEDFDNTTVSLTSKTEIPIYTDTILAFTENPVLSEGEDRLKTNLFPVLSEPFTLYKNAGLLTFEEDYEISDTGDIELSDGLLNGDSLYINYIGKRFIDAETEVLADYTFYDFLKERTNIKISYQADFTDNFYVNVLHASSLMSAFQKDSAEKIQQTSNSSSTGFPSGEIPVTTNADSGNGSYEFDLGAVQNNIVMTQLWYDYFDDRIFYFEEEKRLLKGFKIGAESGRLTQAQIEDSANNPPTRLFPLPDTRPEEERPEPTKLPCLFGFNQNDAGSSAQGWYSDHILNKLNEELTKENNEKTKLNQLLGKSITTGSHPSSGDFDIYGSETMQLYVERNSAGTLIQNNYTITFTEKFTFTGGGGFGGGTNTHRANTASEIASAINSQTGQSIASYSGSTVYLNAIPSRPCVFVVSDAPSVGFGTNSDASNRSRSPWWTGGYLYNIIVPGSYSVHLDIESQNSIRSINNGKQNEQIDKLNGIMREWLPPLDESFNPAKVEKNITLEYIDSSNTYSAISTTFDDIKSFSNGNVFSSIDDPTVLTDRIAEVDARIAATTARINDVQARYNTINETLTREGLFPNRYSWLTILTHRNSGYYSEEKRLIDTHDKNVRDAKNSAAALESMSTFS